MTSRTAAIRYARALLEVTIKEGGDLARTEQELADVVALFTEHALLAKVLLNPAVPVPRKRAAMAEIVGRLGTSSVVAKLLLLLAERDRLVLLPDLLAEFRDRLLDHQHVVRAEVTTAVPIDAAKADAIQHALARLTGRTVTLARKVDPAIMGGIVARIGSTVYDASVTTQLARMKQKLVEGI